MASTPRASATARRECPWSRIATTTSRRCRRRSASLSHTHVSPPGHVEQRSRVTTRPPLRGLEAAGRFDDRDRVVVVRNQLGDLAVSDRDDLDHPHRNRSPRFARGNGERRKDDHLVAAAVEILEVHAVDEIPCLREGFAHLHEAVVPDPVAAVRQDGRGAEGDVLIEKLQDLLETSLRGGLVLLFERRDHHRLEALHDLDVLLRHGSSLPVYRGAMPAVMPRSFASATPVTSE